MKTTVKELEHGEWDLHTISDFNLDIGNNFTYDHIMRAIYNHEEVKTYLDENIGSLSDEITFKCKGNYGEILEETCASDMMDHFRSYDKEIVSSEVDDGPWVDEVY